MQSSILIVAFSLVGSMVGAVVFGDVGENSFIERSQISN
jgi:hypothetical protein